MRFRIILKFIFLIAIAAPLFSCGTKFACGPEFGAPPERAFWCSPLNKIGKYFSVQPSKLKVLPEKVKCKKTLADSECEVR